MRCETCGRLAFYGSPVDKIARFCWRCRRKNNIRLNTGRRKCEYKGDYECLMSCQYGLRGGVARYCSKHSNKLIHVKQSTDYMCQYPNCSELRVNRRGSKFCDKHQSQPLPEAYITLGNYGETFTPKRKRINRIATTDEDSQLTTSSDKEELLTHERVIKYIKAELQDNNFLSQLSTCLDENGYRLVYK